MLRCMSGFSILKVFVGRILSFLCQVARMWAKFVSTTMTVSPTALANEISSLLGRFLRFFRKNETSFNTLHLSGANMSFRC